MKIAINGFGRIGRLVYRIMENDPFFDVVAINDLSSSEELAYLLKYDSNHRNYTKEVSHDEEGIIVDGKKTRVYAENALNELNGTANIHALDVGDLLCSEIDNLEDLNSINERMKLLV